MESFLSVQEDTLLIDVGSGTQDVLYAKAGTNFENWPSFILPSPAKLVAKKISKATLENKTIFLNGTIMGGGFFGSVKNHLAKGLSIKADQEAAYSLYDDLSRVKDMGIEIVDENFKNSETYESCQEVILTDFSKNFWTDFLAKIDLNLPKKIIIAAQDHGVHENVGNREGRFLLFKKLIQENSNPFNWIFKTVPKTYTRLKAIQKYSGAEFVTDTAIAALLGLLSVPEIKARSEREGITIVNIGNSHTIAFLYFQEQVFGIYEHHTTMLTKQNLAKDLEEFRLGWLPDESVRQNGGHGCVITGDLAVAEGFRPTYIIGPKRNDFIGLGQMISTHGNMMLAGAFGLLYAAKTNENTD